MMLGKTRQQPHSGSTINWPITLNGFLGPARKTKLDQYEFYCHDKASITAELPLNPGNPYIETVSQVKGRRNKGLTLTLKFSYHTILGQFHRHRGNEGIWIGSDYTNRGSDAKNEWHGFVSLFGITVGVDDKTIPVSLDFYNTPMIVIRPKSPSE